MLQESALERDFVTLTSFLNPTAASYVIVIAVCMVLAVLVTCPRCGNTLAEYVVAAANPYSAELISGSCAHCGLSLDEPRP
jgi:hypothetical protein